MLKRSIELDRGKRRSLNLSHVMWRLQHAASTTQVIAIAASSPEQATHDRTGFGPLDTSIL